MRILARILFSFQFVIVFSSTMFGVRTISFADAVQKKLIKYTGIKSNTRPFTLDVTNLTKDSLCVQVEAGRIFIPSDDVQPQVVTRHRDIYFASGEQRQVGLNTACGNANAPAPSLGYRSFAKTTMAPAELVNILSELERQRLDGKAPLQQIVWMYTNKHGIERLIRNGMNEFEYAQLVRIISGAKGSFEDPGYRVEYRQPDSEESAIFTGEPIKLVGSINLQLTTTEDVIIQLKDERDQTVKTVLYVAGLRSGRVDVKFDLDVNGIAAGTYEMIAVTHSGAEAGSLAIEL